MKTGPVGPVSSPSTTPSLTRGTGHIVETDPGSRREQAQVHGKERGEMSGGGGRPLNADGIARLHEQRIVPVANGKPDHFLCAAEACAVNDRRGAGIPQKQSPVAKPRGQIGPLPLPFFAWV